MEFISKQKFLMISPKKTRGIVDSIDGLTPTRAIEILPFVGKKGADLLLKVIKSAVANAKQKGVSGENLRFKEIQVNEGPRLKRGRAASRGRWHPYKRRMSHIRVVLETIKPVVKKTKEDKKEVVEKTGIQKKGAKNESKG